MNARKIVIDGKAYNSVEEMPEDVRRNYEEAMRGYEGATAASANPLQALGNLFADANNNGMPDVMENNQQIINLSGGMKFVVDGQTYNGLDELPPEARAKYEQAMGKIDANRNGMPDFLEGMMNMSQQPSQPMMSASAYPTNDTTRHATRAPINNSPAIAPDTSNGWMLALGGLFILMVCALGALGVWYFFLR
ncbi:MAG: hypothetical protein IT314_12090 [Anaerolineales bacterium]|nr:hypothetical protein [Anaerolineales bacterium]